MIGFGNPPLSGTGLQPGALTFTSSGDAMRLSFDTDGGAQYKGFKATFRTVTTERPRGAGGPGTVKFSQAATYLTPLATEATLKIDCAGCGGGGGGGGGGAEVGVVVRPGFGPIGFPGAVPFDLTFDQTVRFDGKGGANSVFVTVPLPGPNVGSAEADANPWGVTIWGTCTHMHLNITAHTHTQHTTHKHTHTHTHTRISCS